MAPVTRPEAQRTVYFRERDSASLYDRRRSAPPLEAFGLHYDTWFFESSLYRKASGSVDKTIARN